MRTLLSKVVCGGMARGQFAMQTSQQAADYFQDSSSSFMSGVIAFDPQGSPDFAQTAPKMTCDWVTETGEIASNLSPLSAARLTKPSVAPP